MNATTAPHPVLQSASFVIAFTGEGAAAFVVQGGWEAMLERFATETIGSTAEKLAEPTHPNAEEWALWLDHLNDVDEWSGDESSQPYCFSSEVGEISHVTIYRLSTETAPTLPHPALDRANAGERESEGAPGATDAERAEWLADKIGACGDYAKEAAQMLRRWPAALPAADPERREGAEGVAFPDAIEKLRRCTLGCGAFGQCKATMHGKPSECAGGVTPSLAGWRFKSKEGGEWHFDNTKPTGHVFCVEPVYALGDTDDRTDGGKND